MASFSDSYTLKLASFAESKTKIQQEMLKRRQSRNSYLKKIGKSSKWNIRSISWYTWSVICLITWTSEKGLLGDWLWSLDSRHGAQGGGRVHGSMCGKKSPSLTHRVISVPGLVVPPLPPRTKEQLVFAQVGENIGVSETFSKPDLCGHHSQLLQHLQI